VRSGGVFFLRGRPTSARQSSAADAGPCWILSLGERTSARGVSLFYAVWRGPEAERFMAANPNLRAGDCLRLELDRLHATNNELRGYVTRCELAPPRWPEPPHTEGADGTAGAPAARAHSTSAAGHFH
jgi:hypothetical protein